MKKTLKIIVLALSILMITSSFSIAGRWTYPRPYSHRPHIRQCWNVMWTERITRHVVHHFVDRDCDRRVDIVQEYRWNGYRWIMTRWWWYR